MVRSAAGFTLFELLVAMGISLGVLGASAALSAQMQGAYRFQAEAAEANQEGRYAIEWIERYLRAAGNNPHSLAVTPCPLAGTPVTGIRFDPDGDGIDDDIRLQADTAPVNGRIGGTAGACTEPGEDLTIAHDAAQLTITLTDNNVGRTADTRSDSIVTGLQFIYRDAGSNQTAIATTVVFIETVVTVRSRVNNPNTGVPGVYVLRSTVRVRNR